MKAVAVPCFWRLTSVFVTFALLASPSIFTAAVHAVNSPSAEITVRSAISVVKLNGETALSGRTFFSHGLIETTPASSADVTIHKLGKVTLSPNSALDLSFSDGGVSGRLLSGELRFSAARGVTVRIETPDNVLTNDPETATVFTVDLTSGATVAICDTGTLTTATGLPAAKRQTTTGSRSIWLPLAIFGGAVGTAAVIVLLDRLDDDDTITVISPVR